jgi:hypothetical protein
LAILELDRYLQDWHFRENVHRCATIFTMKQIDARITELSARLAALERERVEIVAEINTLRSVQSEGSAVTKAVLSGKAGDPVDRNSTIEKKIALFRRLFAGRSDVFPVRWENRATGRSGYAPACANEWQRGICEKPKIKCSACQNQAFLAVDDASIERHLRGTIIISEHLEWPRPRRLAGASIKR